jgi:hypothetical protein
VFQIPKFFGFWNICTDFTVDHILIRKFKFWAGGMAQLVERLPSEREAKFKPQCHKKKKKGGVCVCVCVCVCVRGSICTGGKCSVVEYLPRMTKALDSISSLGS